MHFLVESRVERPQAMSSEEWERLARAESDYGIQARRGGKLVNIWRIAGQYAAFSLWNVDDNDELHQLISGLPMFPFATFTITALATHPSTVRWNQLRAADATRSAT
jgi:muconolactone D-isomerase